MAIQHARVCEACERDCPSWANRCPACGSTAITFQMIITPPSSGNVRKLADSAPRVRRGRVQIALVPEAADGTVRSSA
jgi:RNA polymerase subunit RPABC4/transcription elongation factor Spt4